MPLFSEISLKSILRGHFIPQPYRREIQLRQDRRTQGKDIPAPSKVTEAEHSLLRIYANLRNNEPPPEQNLHLVSMPVPRFHTPHQGHFVALYSYQSQGLIFLTFLPDLHSCMSLFLTFPPIHHSCIPRCLPLLAALFPSYSFYFCFIPH